MVIAERGIALTLEKAEKKRMPARKAKLYGALALLPSLLSGSAALGAAGKTTYEVFHQDDKQTTLTVHEPASPTLQYKASEVKGFVYEPEMLEREENDVRVKQDKVLSGAIERVKARDAAWAAMNAKYERSVKKAFEAMAKREEAKSLVSGENAGKAIVEWNKLINKRLEKGANNLHSRMMAPIKSPNGYSATDEPGSDSDNQYWCTWSIVDSYRLTGLTGLKLPDHGAVVEMDDWWRKGQGAKMGFKYVSWDGSMEALKRARPGDAMLMRESRDGHEENGQHVAMLESVDLNKKEITTLESNSTKRKKKYQIIKQDGKYVIEGTVHPVVGFGGPPDKLPASSITPPKQK